MTVNPAEAAELSLLLDVASGPKPGNVDRHDDHDDMDIHDFLDNAVSLRKIFRDTAKKRYSVGEAIYLSVAEMTDTRKKGFSPGSTQNTQFGSVLLLAPLLHASPETNDPKINPVSERDRSSGFTLTKELRSNLEGTISGTTVDDAIYFYRCFDLLDVHVSRDPPEDVPGVDHPEPEKLLRDNSVTLSDVILARKHDLVAEEWRECFDWSFRAAEQLDTEYGMTGSSEEAVSRTYLYLLSRRQDSLVAEKHGEREAEKLRRKAEELYQNYSREKTQEFDDELLHTGINPGATADILTAGIYINLSTGDVDG